MNPSNKAIIQKALQVLIKHMELLKVYGFVVACKFGEGDYLTAKDQLFEDGTVDSIFEKIQTFEAVRKDESSHKLI